MAPAMTMEITRCGQGETEILEKTSVTIEALETTEELHHNFFIIFTV